MISHRQITSEEYRFAVAVFGNTLPPKDKLYLTNLSHGGGHAFTWPNLDHSVVLNLDKAFENLMAITNGSYPTCGQLFIHEMAHAWQIQTKSFTLGLLCKIIYSDWLI